MGNGSSSAHNKAQLGSRLAEEGLIRECNYDIQEKYEFLDILGRGLIAYVSRARIRDGKEGGSTPLEQEEADTIATDNAQQSAMKHRKQEVQYAIKTFQLNRISSEQHIDELTNTIEILRSADHPNIIKTYEVFSYRHQMHLVMELCEGGNLYSRLPYTEKQSANIVGKLCSAVRYMHKHGIVHRDLKFENILFESTNEDAEIRIVDFGMGKKFARDLSSSSRIMHEQVGSLITMAPEVLQALDNGYTSQSDMWAVGVITYMLLGDAISPFVAENIFMQQMAGRIPQTHQMIGRIIQAEYDLGPLIMSAVSKESKFFIKHLLVKDPNKRMTAKQALDHVWLSKEFNTSNRLSESTISQSVQESLKHYQHTSALKKIALNVIAHKSTAKEILDLRKLFDQYDKNYSGVISFGEFQNALKKSKYTYAEIESIFQSIDVDLNGYINYTEFIAASLDAQGDIEVERIAEAFDRLDSDDSGFITREDLIEILGQDGSIDDQEIENIIKANDENKDGKISWKEFLQMFYIDRNTRLTEIPRLSAVRTSFYYDKDPIDLVTNKKYDENEEKLKPFIDTVQNPLAKSMLSELYTSINVAKLDLNCPS